MLNECRAIAGAQQFRQQNRQDAEQAERGQPQIALAQPAATGVRSGNGENLQMASLSGATSRSSPPSTPTAANSGIDISSPLNIAGIEISTPASSPVT